MKEMTETLKIRYGFRQVGDVEVFYREAGPNDAPIILLLHGFPTASHLFLNSAIRFCHGENLMPSVKH